MTVSFRSRGCISVTAATVALLAAACVQVIAADAPAPPASPAPALPFQRPDVEHVVIVVLENEDADDAYRQPFFVSLSRRGAWFSNFYAITRPSQPNYFALTSGSLHGVDSNRIVNLDVRHLGDLLEAKGLDWKVYAEGYPGNCFLGERARMRNEGEYVRRHVPFLSYVNVQRSAGRCSRVVEAVHFDRDFAAGRLPAFALYIPDNRNNGHDTGVRFAAKAMEQRFGALLRNPRFLRKTLFVVTYDESGRGGGNRILTIMLGDTVRAGVEVRERYDLYSLLRTVEEIFGTGTLGLEDEKATPIGGVWK